MPDTHPNPALGALSDALVAAAAAVATHVVGIRSHRSRASGFVWKPGLIVTADEALAPEGEVAVEHAGDTLAATVVGRDPSTDVALLKVERNDLSPTTLDGVAPPLGALALAVGAREGTPVAAFGIIAASGPAWRSARGGEIAARIELDLSLRRHAEGALVVDAAGRAFGMAVFGPRRRVLAIPGATIERVAAQLESHGRVPRGYLGLSLQPVRLDGGEAVGAMVMGVERNGPGAQAGLHQGDVIAAWDGQPVEDLRALLRDLGPGSVGRTAALTVRRGGDTLTLKLAIGERPAG